MRYTLKSKNWREIEIATLHHEKLISKNLETAEMSLTSVLKAIFETEEEEEE